MPSNLQIGGGYLFRRTGIVEWLFSLSLSCAFLVLVLIMGVRSVLTFYLYTLSPSLSVTNVAVSAAVFNHYNRLSESPFVQPLRLPEDFKIVYRENETHVVPDQERSDRDEGDITAAAGTKEVINLLYTNVEQKRKAAEVHVRNKSRKRLPQVLSSSERALDAPEAGEGGLLQPENAERNISKSVSSRKSQLSIVHSTGTEKVSVTDLLNWKGELEGVDLREPLQNLTSQERRAWLRLNWANFKILQSDPLSEQFSHRLKAFFRGEEYVEEQETRDGRPLGTDLIWHKSPRKRLLVSEPHPAHDSVEYGKGRVQQERATGRQHRCKLRFFMTWISSISSFGLREHICLESIFTFHPTACVVILSRSLDTPEGREILRPLLERGLQILAVSPDLPFLFRDTPAADWFKLLKSGGQDPGDISFSQNLSNILRMAVLYKYGGIYLDNDVLVLRDFSGLQNILGAQSANSSTGVWTRLNNAVMIFEEKSPVLFKFIQEFALTYDGSKWGHNGPYLVTRVIRRLTGRAGYNFSVASPAAFYPVNWASIKRFFQAPNSQEERKWQLAKLEQLERESYAVHLWNKASRNMDVQKESIMDILFQKVCMLCDMSVGSVRSQS